MIDDAQYQRFLDKQETIKSEMNRLANARAVYSEKLNNILAKHNEHIDRTMRLAELLKRPNITYDVLKEIDSETKDLDLSRDIYEEVEVLIKYDGYLKRQEIQIEQASKLEKFRIPENIDYMTMEHISTETKEKLNKIRPVNLAQAARIGGVKPADISVLMVLLNR